MPIGDVQLGSDGIQVDRLKRQLDWAMKQGNVYFIGMGDYIDVMSPSNRASWVAMKKYDSVKNLMTDGAHRLTEDFIKIVRGTEDRWCGLLEGHHYFEFDDGTTSDTTICKALNTTFLGNCAMIRLKFADKYRSQGCRVWAHHGWGSGRSPAAIINTIMSIVPYFEADIYLMGHQSKKAAVKVPYITMNGERCRVLAGTGAFFSGYSNGSTNGGRPQGSYVEKAGMAPAYLGSPLIKVRPVRGSNYDRLDMNVEI